MCACIWQCRRAGKHAVQQGSGACRAGEYAGHGGMHIPLPCRPAYRRTPLPLMPCSHFTFHAKQSDIQRPEAWKSLFRQSTAVCMALHTQGIYLVRGQRKREAWPTVSVIRFGSEHLLLPLRESLLAAEGLNQRGLYGENKDGPTPVRRLEKGRRSTGTCCRLAYNCGRSTSRACHLVCGGCFLRIFPASLQTLRKWP